MADLASKNDVEFYDVLTGFKWIADIIRKNEGIKTFIGGGEESYGFMIGDFGFNVADMRLFSVVPEHRLCLNRDMNTPPI